MMLTEDLKSALRNDPALRAALKGEIKAAEEKRRGPVPGRGKFETAFKAACMEMGGPLNTKAVTHMVSMKNNKSIVPASANAQLRQLHQYGRVLKLQPAIGPIRWWHVDAGQIDLTRFTVLEPTP